MNELHLSSVFMVEDLSKKRTTHHNISCILTGIMQRIFNIGAQRGG